MPGTIQVSVLGFVDLPSSLPSSSISIKVSMGKREHQTWEKGDFSFPLVSLREKLIITIFDAEGNKISDTGVDAISVVEKGFWDDYFPLEGGGHVHMKLQFTLSEEERNRIRMMRESASKKKQSELLKSSPQRSDNASNISNTAASSSSHNREVSAASTGEVATQNSMVSNHVSFCTDPQSGSGIKEGTLVAQEQTNANDTDTSEVTSSTAPVAQGIEIHSTEVYPQGSVKVTTKTPSPSLDVSMYPREVSTLVGSSETSEVTLTTAPMPQRIEVNSTEVYSQGPVQVIKTQSASVDGSMYQKEISTLIGSSDTCELTLSTAPVPRGIEDHSTEVYCLGVQVIKTRSPSVDGPLYPKKISTQVGSSDKSEVTLSTAPVAQGIEIHNNTEVYSRGPVQVLKTQSPSVDGSVYPKDVSTLVGSSDTSEVTSSTDSVPQGFEIHNTEVYSPGSVQVIKTQSPYVDGLIYPKEVSTLVGSSETSEATSSTLPVAQGIEVHNTEVYSPGSVQVIKTQSLSVDAPVYPKEVSAMVGSSELVVSAKNKSIPLNREEDQAQNPEKQGPLEKTPSTVRKMISAFESSRPQDTRPDYKPATFKTPPRKVGLEAPLRDPHTKNVKTEITKPTQESSARVTNLFLKEVPRQTLTNFKRRGEQLNSEEALDGSKSSQHIGQLKELSTEQVNSKGMNSSLKDEVIGHSQLLKKEEKESADLMRVSAVEEATVSGQMVDDEHLVRQQPTNSPTDSEDSGGTSAITNLQRDSNNTLKSLWYHEDMQNSRKSSGTWIFPEEAREICVTTGCIAEATTCRGRMSFSAPQHVPEHSLHGEESFCTPRESELDNPAEVENHKGPVGQAIKVAIMVGFGTLVLLTRQRKNKNR